MKPLGIYIHVPFCDGKCYYCDFYSKKENEYTINLYVQKLISDLKNQSSNFKDYYIDTIYFGGGTPSLLGSKNLSSIVNTMKSCYNLKNPEITLEANPTKANTLDFELLRNSGFNRLSIGLQSALDNELKLLGRRHTASDAQSTISIAKSAGFDNISLDLMIAIPNQTEESLKTSIDFCLSQNISHISAYILKIEEGTVFYKKRNSLCLPNDDKTSELYLFTVAELEKAGFNQYEISNFSKKGKESIHNLKYWNADEYLGFGPSAHSFINNKRFYFERSLKSYLDNNKPIADGSGGSIEEYAMLRLRLKQGLIEKDFYEKFKMHIPKQFYENAYKLKATGLVKVENDSISLSTNGFLVSNELISRIIL